MKLYSFELAPNALRVLMFAAEKDIALDIVDVSLPDGENRQAPYLAKNPTGQVPTLELDDGTCITESLAISRYLDETSGSPSLFGETPLERAIIGMWERRAEFGLLIPAVEFGHHVHPVESGYPNPNTEFGQSMVPVIETAILMLDERLGETAFLGGRTFSIADITAYIGFRVAQFWNIPMPAAENFERWAKEIGARPSTKI